jgi:arylsulfatase A-like enzyme
LGYGADVAAGAAIDRGHIVDIAPTVLEALGVEPPPHFEGRALAALA